MFHLLIILDADDARDNAFIGLWDNFKAFVNSPDEEKQQAAQKLTSLTEQMGWSMWADGYTVETANLNSYKKNWKSLKTSNTCKPFLQWHF